MALRPVPWATSGGIDGEGGAENSVELARADAFVGSSGATGIVDPTDFRVTALPVPGAAVRVRMGTGVIRSTYATVFGQSYIVQEDSYTDVPVTATGSSGGATKYVYVLIEDTQYSGQTPADPANGPYNSYQVTTTLPTFQPYLLLARIDQPASTATIAQSMIVDLREVANPREKKVVFPRPLVAGDDGLDLVSTSAYPDGEYFPNTGGNLNNGRYDINVPVWATRMQVRCEWIGIGFNNNPGAGLYWVTYGDGGGGTSPTYYTQAFGWNSTSGNYVTNWVLEQEVAVRPAWRGTTLPFFPRANFTTKNSGGSVHLSPRSGMVFSVRFMQQADQEDI